MDGQPANELVPPSNHRRRCMSETTINKIGNHGDQIHRPRKSSHPVIGDGNSVPLLATHELNASLLARKGIGGSVKSVDDAVGAGRRPKKKSFFQSLRSKSHSVMSGLRLPL